jgi:CBS domain-containing protein
MSRSRSQAYPALRHLHVADAMHPGLISCSPDTPLRTVARMMATYRVHAILVTTHGGEKLPGGGAWGVISDTHLLRAAQADDLEEQASRAIAATPVLTVATADELAHAAQLMAEHEVSHLIVVEPRTARPIGVLSTLDIVRALAGFPERHPVTF